MFDAETNWNRNARQDANLPVATMIWPPRKLEHQYFYVVLDELLIPEPRERTKSIPHTQMLVLWKLKTQQPPSHYKIMTVWWFQILIWDLAITFHYPFSASEMTYIVSGGALDSTHSLRSITASVERV